jgi:magnesium and cobalt exporter, CNNM family
MDFSPFIGLFGIAILVLANGFFVATEFAIVAVRRSRLQELADEGRSGALAAQQVIAHLDAYIAATQFGITLASLALGWVGEPALARLLEPPLERILGRFAVDAAHAVAISVAFFLITGVHIVVGELAPKGLALQRPETTSLWVARPIQVFHAIFKWPVTALNVVGNSTLRLLGLQAASGHEMVHSVEELRLLVTGMQHAGVVDKTEALLAQRAFDFSEITARAIMTPRTEIEAVPGAATLDALLAAADRAGHSRLVVYEGSIDNVVGVLPLKRLFQCRNRPAEQFDLKALLQQPLIVPETKSGTTLLDEMKRQRNYVAVVVDEYGGTAGIVTVTDLVQTLVGRITDDPAAGHRPVASVASDGSTLVDGLIRVPEFEELIGVDVPERVEGVETIGGLVAASIGRVPRVGDAMTIAGRRIVVESLDGLRIATLRVMPASRKRGSRDASAEGSANLAMLTFVVALNSLVAFPG